MECIEAVRMKIKKQSTNLSVLCFSYCCTQSRDRTGMEVNPLVFETSASTDSAIRAATLKECTKVGIFFCSAKKRGKKTGGTAYSQAQTTSGAPAEALDRIRHLGRMVKPHS